ncbi:MAG: hypothetical protein H6718_06730 [Polyangiaceae bacterium]|nr:hypothetical protein [Myxococcales bacterium]MCB9585073.1 hypothetical protein [Polyangiaceae bacterium]
MIDVSLILSDFDGPTYLNALIAVAQVDGVKPEEEAFINGQAEAMGLPLPDLATPADVAASAVASTVTKRIIVRDCIVLASVDGSYTENERKRIFDVARHLDVSDALVERMERWVTDYTRILEEGQAILSE